MGQGTTGGGPDARRPVLKEGVTFRVLDDLSSMAVDPEAGDAHALNPVATAVLERADGTLTVAEIVDELADTFEAPRGQIEADVAGFLDDLGGRGLIRW